MIAYHLDADRRLRDAQTSLADEKATALLREQFIAVLGNDLRSPLGAVSSRIRQLERELLAWYRSNDLARRIATVPGVGVLGASALAATVTDPSQFRSGRQFAAWLGLTPLNNSSGGKERVGRISKMGDQYLRRLLVTGMTSLVRRNKHHPDAADPRVNTLLARKPPRLVTVALANRAARAIWAIMVRGEIYRMPGLGSAAT
jgi:transposase